MLDTATFQSIIVNLASSLIWFALGIGATVGYRRWAKWRTSGRRTTYLRSSNSRFAANWIRKYYDNRGCGEDLFRIETALGDIRVPSLVLPTWLGLHIDVQLRGRSSLTKSAVPLVEREIQRRMAVAGKSSRAGSIWNGTILCMRDLKIDGPKSQSAHLTIGTCTYFQFLSTCGRLERETHRAISSRGAKTKIRDSKLASATLAAQGSLGAQGLGAQVCLTFVRDDEIWVLFQERSDAVVTYSETYSVGPVFACEPVMSNGELRPDWLWVNFVREYLEEMHNVDDLQAGSQHVDADWFLSHPEAERLARWRCEGLLFFTPLGITIDALNGEANIAVNCHVISDDFVKVVLPAMIFNWEARGFRVCPLADRQLDRDLCDDRFQPGGAVALALSRSLHQSEEPCSA